MTFGHKTVNILFHIRKFLSAKDALNTLCESEISVQTSSRNTAAIFSLYREVYTTE